MKIFSYDVTTDCREKCHIYRICNREVSRVIFFIFKDFYRPNLKRKTKMQKAITNIIDFLLENETVDIRATCNSIFEHYNLPIRTKYSDFYVLEKENIRASLRKSKEGQLSNP
jgi:hypothetical protein